MNKLDDMVYKKTGSFEAKTHFSEIIEKVRQGQTFIVTRRGKPIAQINPVTEASMHPVFGSAKGEVELAPDFDEPLPEANFLSTTAIPLTAW